MSRHAAPLRLPCFPGRRAPVAAPEGVCLFLDGRASGPPGRPAFWTLGGDRRRLPGPGGPRTGRDTGRLPRGGLQCPALPVASARGRSRPGRSTHTRADESGGGSVAMPPPRAAGSGPMAGPPLLLVGLVFLGSRLVILPFQQPATDVAIYARYAWEYTAAAERGVSFYEFHAREV